MCTEEMLQGHHKHVPEELDLKKYDQVGETVTAATKDLAL